MISFAAAVAFFTGAVVGVAMAANTHVIGHIGHGLGDGKDADNYLHPFTDVSDNHSVQELHAHLDFGGIGNMQWSDTCNCQHVHRNWDATGFPDRCFFSGHSSNPDGSGDHALNLHHHYHHDGLVSC
ncbi:MAG TPA: hypothetical protein VHJ34_10860 [Actinomycetota bacterium]|nr:hypothetical protein [Actinomycetota bacterium]